MFFSSISARCAFVAIAIRNIHWCATNACFLLHFVCSPPLAPQSDRAIIVEAQYNYYLTITILLSN